MIFRIGGLFILCIFGAIALSKVPPFSGIGYKAGLLLTVIAYASLVTWSMCRYHRKLKHQKTTAPKSKNLPPWPRQAWGLPLLGSASAALVGAEFVNEGVWFIVLGSVGTILSGIGVLMFCKVALQQGYFPSQYGKFRGISRKEDAAQFFVTVFVFFILAVVCFCRFFLFVFERS